MLRQAQGTKTGGHDDTFGSNEWASPFAPWPTTALRCATLRLQTSICVLQVGNGPSAGLSCVYRAAHPRVIPIVLPKSAALCYLEPNAWAFSGDVSLPKRISYLHLKFTVEVGALVRSRAHTVCCRAIDNSLDS